VTDACHCALPPNRFGGGPIGGGARKFMPVVGIGTGNWMCATHRDVAVGRRGRADVAVDAQSQARPLVDSVASVNRGAWPPYAALAAAD
jgi:hypothetical protein